MLSVKRKRGHCAKSRALKMMTTMACCPSWRREFRRTVQGITSLGLGSNPAQGASVRWGVYHPEGGLAPLVMPPRMQKRPAGSRQTGTIEAPCCIAIVRGNMYLQIPSRTPRNAIIPLVFSTGSVWPFIRCSQYANFHIGMQSKNFIPRLLAAICPILPTFLQTEDFEHKCEKM